ncbi:MAG: DUF3422 domain-containing protein [Steroidobacteraceae bacterium]
MSIPNAWGGQDHPLRRALTEEMHIRRLPNFVAPVRLLQLVVLTQDQPASAVRAHAEALCHDCGLAPPPPGRHFALDAARFALVWEQHSEYCTYTLIVPGRAVQPFDGALLALLPAGWLAAVPGQVLRATQIEFLAASEPEPALETLAAWFPLEELVCCDVNAGEARIWSSFRLHDDGMGRLLIRDQGLHGAGDPARLVQRLQELGNYRNMALLGLSLAQRLTAPLAEQEQRMARLTREIASAASPDEQLFQQLTALSAELARIQAESSYRMSATRAYAQLVEDRLGSLQVRRVAGFPTLTDFTERRLTPAMRTCESFTARTRELLERSSWLRGLLRTRIETVLERQNRDLLDSMNQRAQAQLRLQQAVEGLSVIAISYYAVGLAGYVAKAVSHYLPRFEPAVLSGVLVPLALLGTWWGVRRVRRRFGSHSGTH